MIIPLILGLVLGACVLIFTFQNIATVSVVFLTWHFDGSLAFILVIAVVAGMVLSALFALPDRIHKRLKIAELKREADQLKGTVADKETEVSAEKGKLAATNAYIDNMEKDSPKAQ